MKRILLFVLTLTSLLCCTSCDSFKQKSLNRNMRKAAEKYLKDNEVKFESLKITSIDTVSELGYANLNRVMLAQMEAAYTQQYQEAIINQDEKTADALNRYLNDISNTIDDFEDLMQNGDLKRDGILLYMVTGSFKVQKTDEAGEPFYFFVKPDKKTVHTLDPFGNNLLYENE